MVAQHALKKPGPRPAVVEWAYCFDVHLNAFFPFLLSVYVVQMLAWPCMLTDLCLGEARPPLMSPPPSLPPSVLSRANLISCLLSNALWSAGLLYYIYITFLGYTGEG